MAPGEVSKSLKGFLVNQGRYEKYRKSYIEHNESQLLDLIAILFDNYKTNQSNFESNYRTAKKHIRNLYHQINELFQKNYVLIYKMYGDNQEILQHKQKLEAEIWEMFKY